MHLVHVEVAKSINSVVEELKTIKKEVIFVVELDQFKYTLNTYITPLQEVRDSL